MYPHFAEAAAAAILANALPTFAPLSNARWFEYITRRQWRYVLRTILIEKEKYLEHLKTIRAHDKTKVESGELSLLQSLPEYFWMVEFTLPELFTGNRSKLGEILLDAQAAPNPSDLSNLFLGIRLPALWLFKDTTGQVRPQAAGIRAHVPIFTNRNHDHVW